MKANSNESKVSVMKLQSELNSILKNEHNSFTSLVKTLKGLKGSEAMKRYLDAANLTFDQLTNIDYFKSALTYATFEASNGTTFEAIARKQKDGTFKLAKWSFWLILNAARKVRKEELKAAQKAAKEAKEASLKKIEEEEKAAKEQSK